MRLGLLVLVSLLIAGCNEQSKPIVSDPAAPPGAETGLHGVWTTHGVDETLGEVDVEMMLEEDGRLSMVLILSSGGRRSFPGSWAFEGDELVLSGAYFSPDGESRVRWQVKDGVLVLEDASGRQQEWQRKK
ncbi:MAG: hypothetical protein HOM86_22685 [Gemmatimonadetes bacterium]|nr:hypothetical protein [Gemmatimonadota bacterium]